MILICGELLYESLIKRGFRSKKPIRFGPGGSSFNIATGLSRLGGKNCSILSTVSNDNYGKKIWNTLLNEGVNVENSLYFVDAPCRYYEVSLIEFNDFRSIDSKEYEVKIIQPIIDHYGILEFSRNSDNVSYLAADQLLEAVFLPDSSFFKDFSIIHIGTYSMVVEHTSSTLLHLLNALNNNNCIVSCNFSVKLGVINNENSWRNKIENFLPYLDIIFVNEQNIRQIYDLIDITELAKYWLNSGIKLIIMTHGIGASEGVSFYANQFSGKLKYPAFKIRNPIGAEDTLQATFLKQLEQSGIKNAELGSNNFKIDLVNFLTKSVGITQKNINRMQNILPKTELETYFNQSTIDFDIECNFFDIFFSS